jgi:nucleoside-diphosphate-sugar epimerase
LTLLSSFPRGCNVAVIGASGGVGQAFVELMSGDERVDGVHAFSRTPIEFDRKNVRCHFVDLTDEPRSKRRRTLRRQSCRWTW